MQKEIKKNPKKNPNRLICIRNAKKKLKKIQYISILFAFEMQKRN